jgi:hypothetical protein
VRNDEKGDELLWAVTTDMMIMSMRSQSRESRIC